MVFVIYLWFIYDGIRIFCVAVTMATRTMIFLGGFIGVKTMANFHKGTWKLWENIRCVGGGEIITDIKTHY